MHHIKPIDTKVIYLYDLPSDNYTSVKLAQFIQAKTGYKLNQIPQVRRELNKPHYSAVVKIDDPDKYKEVAKALRHFQFEGHPCRGLPYQTEFLGSNLSSLKDNSLFVRKISKDIYSDKLEEEFSEYGDILSCKVSIDDDYKSRGYGFICYRDQESADKALKSR